MKRFKLISAILFIIMMMILSNCKKESINPPVSAKTYPVSFAPSFYGEVVPWLGQKQSRAFGDFTNKFLNHVIRIRRTDHTFVVDIPIVSNTTTGQYTTNMGNGSFVAEVIPIINETATLPSTLESTYTAFTITDASSNRAAIYTRNPVAFTVTGGILAPIVLNCVTDMACLQINFGEIDYVTAAVPPPDVVTILSTTFLPAHNTVGLEEATIPQLLVGVNGTPHGNQVFASLDPVTYLENDKIWYDATSRIYYYYTLPGSTSTLSVPAGDGTLASVSNQSASYLTFNLDEGFRTIWLKDYYTTKSWLPNTTLRVNYTSAANITVNQIDWFGTIIQ